MNEPPGEKQVDAVAARQCRRKKILHRGIYSTLFDRMQGGGCGRAYRHVQVAGRLRDRHTPIAHQLHRLELELAAEGPSLSHGRPPVLV